MLSLVDALAKVSLNVAPAVDPVLTNQDIFDILTDLAGATTWAVSTPHTYGQIVVPTVPLGRRFICVLPGTSGTTEPPWLIAPAWTGPVNPLAGTWWGQGVIPFVESVSGTPWFWGLADGTCAWRDYGGFAGELYDVRVASYRAWLLKASRATSIPKRKRVGPLLIDSLTYEQCLQYSRLYAPLGFM